MSRIEDRLKPGDAVMLVDAQVDFFPGGNLPVADGDAIIPVLNQWLEVARTHDLPVFASRDWHPVDHVSFVARGGPWPPHCVQDSPGAAFHPGIQIPVGAVIITKGDRLDTDQYSAFDRTDLATRLRDAGIRRLWIGGLAQDVCVRATVLDALKEGFEVNLIRAATRPVCLDQGERAISEMAEAGAHIETDT